LEPVSR
jgi:hypothetical protein